MARIIWTPEAFRNLDDLSDYMRRVAPEYADALVAGIVAAVRPTATYPHIGRMVPEFDRDSLREVIFENYRMVYLVRDETVFVAHVFHASMDVATRLREIDDVD